MELIDSHSHIDFTEFDHDRSEAILRAKNVGVSHIIISSTTANGWKNIADITNANNSICHAAYGLHPMFMDEIDHSDLDKLKEFLLINKAQLDIAMEFKLPVIIHARKSLDIILKHLRNYPALTGSIHSFSGSEQQAKQLIDLGFYLGFGGPITYSRATRLQKLVKILPLDSMLIETDSPDQPDSSHHQQRNEPAYLPCIANCIAKIRNIDTNQVAAVTTNNAKALFHFFPVPENTTRVAKPEAAAMALQKWFKSPDALITDVQAINKSNSQGASSWFSFSVGRRPIEKYIIETKLAQKDITPEVLETMFYTKNPPASWWQPTAVNQETYFSGSDQGRSIALIYNPKTKRGVLVTSTTQLN
ncbi:putative metal-dependent hydrolase YjjV [Nymphon striatum]|nr:putative metal-dependent hydrolase YjjV [Nymphon striatum]